MIKSAFAVLVLAVAVLAWTSWRAVHVDLEPHIAQAPDDSSAQATDSTRLQVYPPNRLLAAVDKDPFHPERRRPDTRFQLPSPRRVVAPQPAKPPLRVLGTAVGVNGGFAMCSWAGAPPRIVRVGGKVGDWTLTKVTRGAAEFTGTGGARVVIEVAKAGTP